MKVSGTTLTYSATASGMQHAFQSDDGTTVPFDKPAVMTVSFGDGARDDGGEAGMACLTKSGVNRFSSTLASTHTYKAPGTYRVTVRTEFCGDAGATAKTSVYTVTVR